VKSSVFQKDLRLRDVKRLRLNNRDYLSYYHQNLRLAKQKNNRKMEKALKKVLRRNSFLFWIRDIDRQYLRNTLRKFVRFVKHRHVPDKPDRILPRP